jgi:transcriptional regulator with XRE-family HTH domain
MEHDSRTPSNQHDYNTELRILMLRRGLTQAQLAEQLGVTRPYMNRILTGRADGFRVRVRLVREFGFPEWLLDPAPRPAKVAA